MQARASKKKRGGRLRYCASSDARSSAWPSWSAVCVGAQCGVRLCNQPQRSRDEPLISSDRSDCVCLAWACSAGHARRNQRARLAARDRDAAARKIVLYQPPARIVGASDSWSRSRRCPVARGTRSQPDSWLAADRSAHRTDRDARTVSVLDVKCRSRFPNATDAESVRRARADREHGAAQAEAHVLARRASRDARSFGASAPRQDCGMILRARS